MATLAIAEVPQALAGAVTEEAIGARLLARAPACRPGGAVGHGRLAAAALGVAQEVAPLAGVTTETQRWNLAVRAVCLGTALATEAALFPIETGLEQTGLSRSLEVRYAAVLAQLDGEFSDDTAGQREPHDPPAPRGSFPPAQCYPDPARW